MDTIQIQKDQEMVVNLLKQGKIVAIPTDTVYGLAVLYGDVEALKALKQCKQRPEEKPIPVMVGSVEQMKHLAYMDDTAIQLATSFMPGAFTMILKKKEEVPDCFTNDYPTIAIRMPDDSFILDIIQQCKKPLFVTSANVSGEQPGANAQEVYARFHHRIAAVVQGKTKSTLASTIVDLSNGNLHIVRGGLITKDRIQQTLRNAKKCRQGDKNENCSRL